MPHSGLTLAQDPRGCFPGRIFKEASLREYSGCMCMAGTAWQNVCVPGAVRACVYISALGLCLQMSGASAAGK